MLTLSHISKTFNPGTVNEKKALEDLSLHLEPGDGRQDPVGLLPWDDRAHADLRAVLRGDHDQHPAHR